MIRNRLLLKSISVFLILETLFSTIAPTISWALTSGPTAPEATSFEPVDTTDMVNLATGDLAYNIPLLEVPGPSGGYPLSLSYHAGIQPNEDASWVGLGWTLNTGAIVRNVNGFADDQLNVSNSSRYFWNGGNTENYSIGVSVGVMQSPASVSAGLSFSQDTYQGSGVGMYLGAGYMIGSGVGIGAKVGISPYGDPYASAGISLSTPVDKTKGESESLSVGVGISTNFKSVGFYGSVSVSTTYEHGGTDASASLLGATISTGNKGVSAGVSAAGASLTNNSASSYISSSTKGFDIPIPVWYGVWVNHGYSYQRYWIDQIDNAAVNGSLYYPDNSAELSPGYFDDKAFDTYSLLDPTLDGSIVDNPNSDKVLGGSFPGYDNYLVHAQGLSGYMRPYYFQRHLYKRNNYSRKSNGDREYQTIQYDISKSNPGEDNMRAEFRFINDFSNRFEFTPGSINFNPSSPDQNPLQYNFSDGSGTRIGEEALSSYTTNQVQGSNYINWFTNKEILTGASRVTTSGFMETVSTGFKRQTPDDLTDDGNIGGFVIVNQSGVKYHFALPAYSFEEYIYSGNKTGTETFNEFIKGGKYAYTWYLTGITGPDYVDRGPNGIADGKFNEYDWGYWVEFEYGKWTDQYAWRNPSEGMASDLDNNFQNFSAGVKEVYYLDAIRTKTHTALFFKEIRHDGKSTLNLLRDVNNAYSLTDVIDGNYTTSGRPPRVTSYKVISHGDVHSYKSSKVAADIKSGGFTPKNEVCSCNKAFYHYLKTQSHGKLVEVQRDVFADKGSGSYTPLPVSSLKLKSIILIDNSALKKSALQKVYGNSYEQKAVIKWNATSDTNNKLLEDQCDFSPTVINYHLYQNILDVDDLSKSDVRSKASRIIEFDSDETKSALCPGTANSFDFNLLKGNSPSVNSDSYPRFGKLTLNGITFLGKGGANLIPPMKFQYELDEPVQGNSTLIGNLGKYSFYAENSKLNKGDILKLAASDGNMYYAVVMDIKASQHQLKMCKGDAPPSGMVAWQQTKNPPYDKDAYDSWGLYKSDFSKNSLQGDERLGRFVTDISAQSLDVWSLRSVKSVTGATIEFEYEPDSYSKPVLYQSNNLVVENIQKISDTEFKITLSNSFPDMNEILKPGVELKYNFLFGTPLVYIDHDRDYSQTNVEINMQKGSLNIEMVAYSDGKWIITTSTNLNTFFEKKKDVKGPPITIGYRDPVFVCGNISMSNDIYNVGGGVRLKSVQMESSDKVNKTTYSYNTMISQNSNNTSGVTSYEPGGLENIKFNFHSNDANSSFFNNSSKEYIKKVYKKSFYDGFDKLLSNSREVPPPGVLYQYVKVEEYVIRDNEQVKMPNYTRYEFEVFKNDFVDIQYNEDKASDFAKKRYSDFVDYSRKQARNVTLKDYTSRVGSLKSITLYNDQGQVISKTTNHYLHDETPDNSAYETKLSERFNNQGVIEESFSDARFSSRKDADFELQGVISKREQYPVIQVGQTTTNYKTGITTTNTTLAFDYHSGQAIRTQAKDGYGNVYITESTPAYQKYSSMGLGATGGKNMLTQEAASYTYKVNPSNSNEKLGLVSASIQTWSDQVHFLNPDDLDQGKRQTGIWRKRASYSFIGDDNVTMQTDGLYHDKVTPFEAWNIDDPVDPVWQKNAEITLYDVQSHALEAIDLNNNYAATRMTSDQNRVLATAANARYNEFACSGAEDVNAKGYSGNAIYIGVKNSSTLYAHTGSYSHTIESGKSGFQSSVRIQPKKYDRKIRVSFWVHKSTAKQISLSYSFVASLGEIVEPEPITIDLKKARTAGDWILCEVDIPVNFKTIGNRDNLVTEVINEGPSTIYVDDFRVHPVDAAVTSYVYNTFGELTHILDNNNLYTRYEYDGMGRLQFTFKESFQSAYGKDGIVKTADINYNYGRNNPYMISINAFATGLTGYVYPGGVTQVEQGGAATFEIRESCSNPRLESVEIDGKPLTLNQEPVVLQDGTRVSGTKGAVRFTNVQSAHSLKVVFRPKGSPGIVECESFTNNDKTCYTGGYKYAYYDACGNRGAWQSVSNFSSLPASLQPYATRNCCQLNDNNSTSNPLARKAPGDCGCNP